MKVEGSPVQNIAGTVAAYDPSVDYFPDKAAFRHATQIRITYHRSYKVIDLTLATREHRRLILYQRGTPPPSSLDGTLIAVPVERYALSSFRYAGTAAALHVVDEMVALSNWRQSTSPAVKARIDDGSLPGNYSTELVAGRDAEVLFTYYSSASLSRDFEELAALGILAIPMAEHLEMTPLGKSEWIKFFAAFFNREREAETIFSASAERYRALAASMAGVTERPRVFVFTADRDQWNLFGSQNAFARLVRDAGGTYVWDDVPGSLSITSQPIERALERGLDADVWLIGADFASFAERPDFISAQPFPSLGPLLANRVFVAHATGDGPNHYWDHALYQPELELADHIRMLHPDRLPDHGMRFYRQIPVPSTLSSASNGHVHD